MAKQNAINNFVTDLTVDPGASGDSYVQFDIASTGKFRVGVDDDASDSFKISSGSALGTNDTFIVTSAGEITKPLQPAFLGILESDDSGVLSGSANLGAGTALTEIFDQGGDFTTAGVFTAPISGRYMLSGVITVGGTLTTFTIGRISFFTDNHIYWSNIININAAQDSSSQVSLLITVLADMDAGDEATVGVNTNGAAGVGDFIGDGTDAYSYFSGFLAV